MPTTLIILLIVLIVVAFAIAIKGGAFKKPIDPLRFLLWVVVGCIALYLVWLVIGATGVHR